MADSRLIDIAAEVRHETYRAYCIWDGMRSAWLPKSQVEVNGDGTITMPEWLAREKELV